MRPVGVILAGGLSSRMGRDKALVDLGGRPLVSHAIERLGPQVEALAINANGDPDRMGFTGLPVLPDPLPGQLGPLVGILAALYWAASVRARAVVTLPIDTQSTLGSIGINTRAQTALDPAGEYFAEILRRVVAEEGLGRE